MKIQYKDKHYEVIGAYVPVKDDHKKEGELLRIIANWLSLSNSNPKLLSIFILRDDGTLSFHGIARELFLERFSKAKAGGSFKYRKMWKRLDLGSISFQEIP
jgi:hypothetical protein